MSFDPKRAQAIFNAAVELTEPAERAALLDRECAGDSALRRRVEALLAAHDDSAGLPGAAPDRTSAYVPPGAQPGAVIAGRYKLLEQIGEGGMGSVWVAEQREPVKRIVGLKLIKAGMDSNAVLARFEAERQALAMMDHTNIAKVLDGGNTEQGHPFFVMELVKGLPLNEYCDDRRLSVRDRLELFVQICSAVQHAHQKGIIHRDLKPSNVLVTEHDGRPVPKVIDFGLAKALHATSRLTERTLHTAYGTVVGTPLYMAPEQVGINALDVDTRTDIYSLGVLLYELLTGTTPLEKARFKEAAWDEIKRLIREEEPPRPSKRLSSTDSLPSLAANRHIEPAGLTKLLRGELDWIVMKALEKDRNRRYETANGFAMDVQRYLAGESVLAVPPSTAYRLKKFVRRNRPQVIVLSVVLVGLLTGIAGTTWGLITARRSAQSERLAKIEADEKRIEADRQRVRAEAGEKLAGERLVQVDAEKKKVEEQHQKAEEEKRIAQAINYFLQHKLLGQAHVMAQADNLLARGESSDLAKYNPTIQELLDRAAEELTEARIAANFPERLQLQAEILQTMGNTYLGIGEFEQAVGFLARSRRAFSQHLGPEHPDTLHSMNNLARAYRYAGKLDLALPLFEETLKLTKAKLGDEHPDTLICMSDLAHAYNDVGKLDLSQPLLEKALKLRKATLGAEHRDTLVTMNDLAIAYRAAGKPDLAVPLLEETLKLMNATLGVEHPHTLNCMNNLATAYGYSGKLDLSRQLFEETLKLTKAKLGPEHPDTLDSMNNLAAAYWRAKQLDLSVPLLEETLKLKEKKLGRGHPDTQRTVANLGVNYRDAGRLAEGLLLLEEAYRASKQHPRLDWVRGQLIKGYVQADKPESAARLQAEALDDARQQLPKDSLELASQLAGVGHSMLQAKLFTEVEPLLRECLAIREKKGPDDWQTFNTQSLLGGALAGQKKYADAEPLLLAGYQGMKQRADKMPPQAKDLRLTEAVERLVQLYEALDKKDEAAKWWKELEGRKGAPPGP